MNRVIKFRAWDNKGKRLFPHAFLVRNDGLTFRQYDGGGHIEDFTVMQFTGLLDSKGREIYEGDVVKYEGENRTVEMDSLGWTLMNPRTRAHAWDYWHPENCEIIGNIYENKDLLV